MQKEMTWDATPQQAFALMLETACHEFETLLALVCGELRLDQPEKLDQIRLVRAAATIRMALAKSFVFNANRANRICWKNKAQIQLNRKDREDFLQATKPLTDVRDVIEHGFDGDVRSEKNKPSMHSQAGGSLDETSLVILGTDQILIGPVNLYEIYRAVERVRNLAGFAALA